MSTSTILYDLDVSLCSSYCPIGGRVLCLQFDKFSMKILLWVERQNHVIPHDSWANVSASKPPLHSQTTYQKTSCRSLHLYKRVIGFTTHKHPSLYLKISSTKIPFIFQVLKSIFFSRFIKSTWVSVCLVLFKLRKFFDCLHLRLANQLWQQQKFPKATLQSMWGKMRWKDSWFQYHIWTSLHSKSCWVKLKKNLDFIIQWVVSQFLAEKTSSLISFLA